MGFSVFESSTNCSKWHNCSSLVIFADSVQWYSASVKHRCTFFLHLPFFLMSFLWQLSYVWMKNWQQMQNHIFYQSCNIEMCFFCLVFLYVNTWATEKKSIRYSDRKTFFLVNSILNKIEKICFHKKGRNVILITYFL